MGLFANLFRNTSRDGEFLRLCARGTLKEVHEALNSWAYAGAKNKDGQTALMSASINPDANIVKLVIAELKKQNINIINAPNNMGMTALHVAAAYNNNPEVIRILAEAGANFNARDNSGHTPLMTAVSTVINDLANSAYRDNTALVKALIGCGKKRGCGIDTRDGNGYTALHWLAMSGVNPAMIRVLVEGGADLEAKDAKGGTPIFCAVINPSTVMLKALIDAGADTDCNDNDGISVLIYAIISLANGHTTLNHIKLLIDNMSYFDNFDINGATAMIYAAQLVDYPEVVKMLIDAGADLTEEDFDGHTALDWAIHVHNSAAVSMLSARGARRNL